MSRTKQRAPKEEKAEKKRKRQEEDGDGVPKKPKKSRKSDVDQDGAASDEQVADNKKTFVDKKSEQEEKNKKRKERKEKVAAESFEQIGYSKSSDNDDVPVPDASYDVAAKADKKKSKKEKKEKENPSKKSKDTAEADSAPSEDVATRVVENDAPAINGADDELKVSKKEKKEKKKDKKEKKESKSKKAEGRVEAAADDEPVAKTNGDAIPEDQDAEADGNEIVEPGKKGRFIVFVGNLPYSATKESISEHFAKLHPTDIRLRTYKGNEKFMGTCFIEFDRFDRMETCLKKYHHSVFPDGKKKEGRKINVELSAGGGGNSESRKTKIVAKNDKLHDERARDREKRAELEMKQGERKEKKDAKKKGDKKGEAEETEAKDAEPDNAGMHPARLAMMQAPQLPTHRQRF